MLSFSVVIPTLNEAENIESLLIYLKELDPQLEIIVADGNSSDDTVIKAKKFAKIVLASRGRGAQMNAGAQAASGDILWFVHADCHPHPESIHTMRKTLANENIIGGAFEYRLNHSGFRFRLAETLSNYKNRLLKLLFGDMGIFVRKEIFQQMAGYQEIPLMEDMDFSKRLKKYGKIVILPQQMDTSARRWIEEGYLKNSIRSWTFQSAWALGASSDTLAKWYKFNNQ